MRACGVFFAAALAAGALSPAAWGFYQWGQPERFEKAGFRSPGAIASAEKTQVERVEQDLFGEIYWGPQYTTSKLSLAPQTDLDRLLAETRSKSEEEAVSGGEGASDQGGLSFWKAIRDEIKKRLPLKRLRRIFNRQAY